MRNRKPGYEDPRAFDHVCDLVPEPPIMCRFEFINGETGKVEIYERPIEFPDKAPVAFHALCQWGYEVFHQEKLALKARIDELESQLAKKRGG